MIGSKKINEFNKIKNLLSWIVFLFSAPVILISLISVVFPAIIVSSEPLIPGVKDTSPDPF